MSNLNRDVTKEKIQKNKKHAVNIKRFSEIFGVAYRNFFSNEYSEVQTSDNFRKKIFGFKKVRILQKTSSPRICPNIQFIQVISCALYISEYYSEFCSGYCTISLNGFFV